MAVSGGMEISPGRIVIQFDWPEFVATLRKTHLACSQERMARELEVSAKTISNWERAMCKPQWRHQSRLFRLAVRNKYRRKQWPARSWVQRWCDDLPPRYLRRRSIRRKYSRRKTDSGTRRFQ